MASYEHCFGGSLVDDLKIERFIDETSNQQVIDDLSVDGWLLEYADHQTPDMCIVAIENDAMNLQFVKNQTIELCQKAVDQNVCALQFVKVENQKSSMVFGAIDRGGFKFVATELHTPDLCEYAVLKDSQNIEFMTPTPRLIMLAKYGKDGEEAARIIQRKWLEVYFILPRVIERHKSHFISVSLL